MKAAIRSAEASRSSSCPLADRIATLSISKYHQICPPELKKTYKQTVLATFLAQYTCAVSGTEVLDVVALGVGTKYLPWALLCEDKLTRNRSRVKDCHAEIIARRSFLLYMLRECHSTVAGFSDIVEILNDGYFALKPGVKIHFYSSSQPCGNASIKKWAKGKTIHSYPDLGPYEYPEEIHSRLHITARMEGQVALLVKRSRHDPDGGAVLQQKYSGGPKSSPETVPRNTNQECPPGTADIASGCGCIMTCSDKIAKWNALGVQGGLLSVLFTNPIYISTCTIGRKYSKPHLERALCCRLQDFCFSGTVKTDRLVSESGGVLMYRTQHPSMLSTSVKFDEGTIATGSTLVPNSPVDSVATSSELVGARFDQPYCLSWSSEVAVRDETTAAKIVGKLIPGVSVNIIDSRSGLRLMASDVIESLPTGSALQFEKADICGDSLFEYFLHVVDQYLGVHARVDNQLKRSRLGYQDDDVYSKRSSRLNSVLLSFYLEDDPVAGLKFCDESVVDDIRTTFMKDISTECRGYGHWKEFAAENLAYYRAKTKLLSDPKLFSGWISNRAWHSFATPALSGQ